MCGVDYVGVFVYFGREMWLLGWKVFVLLGGGIQRVCVRGFLFGMVF